MARRRRKRSRKRGRGKAKEKLSRLLSPVDDYTILTKIFKYLSYVDLASVAKVNSLWCTAANDVVVSRKEPEVIYKIIKDTDTVEFDAGSFGRELKAKPKFTLFCEMYRQQQDDNAQKANCHCQSLPKSCRITFVQTSDLECDKTTLGQHASASGSFACISIPEIPKLKVQVLTFKENAFNVPSRKRKHTMHLSKKLAKIENSVCVFMFTNPKGHSIVKNNRILGNLRRSQPGQLAIVGGQCEKLKSCNSNPQSATCSEALVWTAVILRCPYMQSWSIVLPHSCHSNASELLQRLYDFRKPISNRMKEYSVGYIFSNEYNNIDAFKQVFENVPMVSLCGSHQFGLDTLNPSKKIVHSDSIVFLILTYDFADSDVKKPLIR